MNYFFKIMILFAFIFNITIKTYGEETTNNSYLDKNNVKYKDLLSILEKKTERVFDFPPEWSAPLNDIEEFRKFYLLGLEHHNTGNYEEAIDNYIQACKIFTVQIAYYQLGLSLMEIKAYENAEIAFKKSLDFVHPTVLPEYEIVKDFYTYDNNGQTRETYFAYYNIGCIEALQGWNDTGTQYICEAIFHGYPYLDHIKNDSDIKGIVNSSLYWETIRKTYNAGYNNIVAGKGFEQAWEGAPGGYYFTKDNIVYRFEGGVGIDEGLRLDGEYEVRNHLIIIKNIHYYTSEQLYGEQYFEYIKIFDTSEYFKYGGTLEYKEVPVENYKKRFSDRVIPQDINESVKVEEIEMPDNKENAFIQNNNNDKKLNLYIWIIAAFLGVGIIVSVFIIKKKRK
jgi:tetratricopeptide (TPR) repeat protein